MGKRGGWVSAVKKAFAPESKENKDQKTVKPKKRWFGKPKKLETLASAESASLGVSALPIEELKVADAENEQSKHAYSVAIATAVAALQRLRLQPRSFGSPLSLDPPNCIPWLYAHSGFRATTMVAQKVGFRGNVQRALRALRGLVRLKTLIQGQSVKRQATTSLRCMQTLARVQSQIRSRRNRMSEENQALQRQLHQKHETELERLTASANNEWNDSTKSKEEVEARLVYRQEATTRRERALAYAYSHQNSSKSANPTFMDPNNPRWGWSWLERWMAARPWETRSTFDNHDRGSVKSTISHATSIGDISKSYARRDLNLDIKPFPMTPTSRAPSRQSPATPTKAQSSLSAGRKLKPASPRGFGWGGDKDSRSRLSIKSEWYRRHSIVGSSVRDDESFTSSPLVPSYMASTEAARARSQLSSPMGSEKTEAMTTEKEAASAGAKKRLSFPASPTAVVARRHSGPPKVYASPIKKVVVRNFTGES